MLKDLGPFWQLEEMIGQFELPRALPGVAKHGMGPFACSQYLCQRGELAKAFAHCNLFRGLGQPPRAASWPGARQSLVR